MNMTLHIPNQGGVCCKAKIAEATPAAKQRVQAVSTAFRNILLIVLLILIFAVVQTCMLWRVCNTGMKTATSMETQGLPTLNTLASLQENLALYRLDSYEYLFAKEEEMAGKAKAAEAVAVQIHADSSRHYELRPIAQSRPRR